MSAIELIQLASHAVFVLLAAVTVAQAVRARERGRVDTALFFGAIALAVLRTRVETVFGPFPELVADVAVIAVMALPYLLLRLLDDFAGVRPAAMRLAELGLGLSAVAPLLAPADLSAPVTLALVAYFVTVMTYATVGFVRLARISPGVTGRRMQAVALGSGLLATVILVAGALVLVPGARDVTAGLTQLVVLVSALSYFAGFATPNWLRRFWREPELRAFLAGAAELPRLPDTDAIVAEVERRVGASMGARAAVGLWDGNAGVLRFRHLHDELPDDIGPSGFASWRVFESQRAMYVPDASEANPGGARAYRAAGIGALLAAPITAGTRRLGVLVAYADRPPIFAEEGLAYIQLLADQAAVVLESRALIDEAARVRAQEEATRLKEDFISAAAHDLKTPLTTLLGQAQLLERKFRVDPTRAGDRAAVERMVRTSTQLADLIRDLLDASRLEQGRFELHAEPTDLLGLATAAVADEAMADRVTVEGAEPVVVDADAQRVRQALRNLVENALKYSPARTPVVVRVWEEGSEGRLSVRDQGIGIPPHDLPQVFQRFRRASNVDDRRYSGMGLGLFICRGIVEQHGGRIWAESVVGAGSTFHVALPLSAPPAG